MTRPFLLWKWGEVLPKFNDVTGKRFTRLVAMSPAGKDKHGNTTWLCKCDCGEEKIVPIGSLTSGNTKSCGCLNRENLSKNPNRTIHGMSKTRLYNTWNKMKNRCNSPNSNEYKYYGGRGIKVCDEWQKFEPFCDWALANGYSDDLSIDRIDNDGNYEPSNCRWVDFITQVNNRSSNVRFTYNGKSMTISEIARETGVSKDLLYGRLEKGYSLEDSLKYPPRELPWSSSMSKYITWNGKTQNVDQWARELGMRPGALRYRLNEAKWSVEKAFTTPVKNCAKGA